MTDYRLLAEQLRSLMEDEPYYIPVLSNASALIMETVKELNWAGFYLVDEKKDSLLLGPFQGKVACIRIPIGKGVCGTAAAEDRTLCVEDVHQFPGHIACDSASNSELVVPVHKDGKLVGVLDLDSTQFSRFTKEDVEGFELFVKTLEEIIVFEW
ncbi:MAG: GAF domain-containing protein [Lachnospiraceae bacterium]|nr:GAF domain-containing protein [Lachnospiraceae bacterium]